MPKKVRDSTNIATHFVKLKSHGEIVDSRKMEMFQVGEFRP